MIQLDDPGQEAFLSAGPHKKIAIHVKALEVQNGVVRLMVRARVFEAGPGSAEDMVANHQLYFFPKK